ncbi:MAG: VOC family protein [Sandaracinaceae bacterium]
MLRSLAGGSARVALTALTMLVAGGGAAPAPVPALPDTEAAEHKVGKFVWADLFTAEVDASRAFYAELFGWRWQPIARGEQPYEVADVDGRPVAGMVFRAPPRDAEVRGTWLGYVATDDAEAAAASVTAAGGRVLVPPVDVPDRGVHAIFADPEGAVFGVLEAPGGDPADYRAEPGEWAWVHLFADDVEATTSFYAGLFGYEDHAWGDAHRVLASAGASRAGVGPSDGDGDLHPGWLGFVRVEDVEAAVARAGALGGETLFAPTADVLDGELAVVADPAGAAVGLLELSDVEADAWEGGPDEESRESGAAASDVSSPDAATAHAEPGTAPEGDEADPGVGGQGAESP